jgi:predicted TIM-barrel fold metal-dependent hydrolase
MAAIFPELKFVMVHMGMDSDNSEAIALIKETSNIYGDTCVVKHKNVIKAIKECGADKILFGTDSIVNGIDTYKKYIPLVEKIKETFAEEEVIKVLGLNCMTIFNLPVSFK